MRILVADDDRVISGLVCAVLRQSGHVPIPAFDAMQAMMFAIRAPAPSAIVLDINMPGGTGIEALRKLKMSAKTAPIPVVILSASTDPDVPALVRALGAVEFVPKPVDPEALLAAIERALAAG